MTPEHILVTGSSGLVGSEAVEYFDRLGHRVTGVDNNLRRFFFGEAGDTSWNLERLRRVTRRFEPLPLDIRDRDAMLRLFRERRFDLVVHCAGQPSHDKAREFPLLDFDVNAVGTVNLLEAARLHAPDSVFVFLSTNKVYGDAPNELPLVELETRFDYARPEDRHGIGEDCRIDRSLHSLFGASKTAADVMTQEYARTFGLRTVVLRGGCLTGPNHSGVELHGFLSWLARTAFSGSTYTIYGYKGKQVRDNIHSFDVVRAIGEIWRAPRPGEVYNIGGGRANSISVLEAIARTEEVAGRKIRTRYVNQPRLGDHICYISDLRKIESHYPGWRITRSLDDILREVVAGAAEYAAAAAHG
jgi:CDP-paratose 2-epimerase